MKRIRVAQIGLGAMGQMMVSQVVDRPDMELVGAFDTDAEKIGKDAGELCSVGHLGIKVEAPMLDALRAARANIALHATGSFLVDVHEQLRTAMKAGLRVISTCEELSYPYHKHAQLAADLNALAKAEKVPLLGSGVNPGFVMDLLPLILSGVCKHVSKITVLRVINADTKRLGFQKKIGAGMTVAQFKERIATGRFGHIGLPESAWLICDAVGWEPDAVEETVDPVVAETPFDGRLLKLAAGQVSGLNQRILMKVGGQVVVELQFLAALGADDPRDETRIEGIPDVHMRIGGGVPGDVATASVIVNTVPVMLLAAPGLLTAKDMIPLHSRKA
ncbi:MAG: NAD(P)H-dependent amine dehydrogenase family protein [Candidatus Xenobia bacterium]